MIKSDSVTRRRSSVDTDVIRMVLEECDTMEPPPTERIQKDLSSKRHQSRRRSSTDSENSTPKSKPKDGLMVSSTNSKEHTSNETLKMSLVEIDFNESSSSLQRVASESKLKANSRSAKQRRLTTTLTNSFKSKMEEYCDIKLFSSSQEEQTSANGLRSSGGKLYSSVTEPGSPDVDENPNPIAEQRCLPRKMRYGLYFTCLFTAVLFFTHDLFRTAGQGNDTSSTGDSSQDVSIVSPSDDNSSQDTSIVSPYMSSSGLWEVTDQSYGEIAESVYGCSLVQSSDTKVMVIGECGLSIAHVFKRDIEDGYLDQIYTFLGPNESQFGYSSSLSKDGKIVAIGGPSFRDEDSLYQGIVKVFQLHENDEGIWESEVEVDLFGNEGDHFGHCLALSLDGSTLVVGAPQLSSPNGTGYIIIYDLTEKKETSIGFKIEGRIGSRIGTHVEIIDTSSIIFTSNPGIIQRYALENGVWVEQDELVILKFPQESEELLAFSSASSGSFLATGVSSKEEYEAGTISIYELKHDQWVKQGRDLKGFSKDSKIEISEDGCVLVVADENIRVLKWNGEEWEKRDSIIEIKGGLIALPKNASTMTVGRPTLAIAEKGNSIGEVMTYQWKEV